MWSRTGSSPVTRLHSWSAELQFMHGLLEAAREDGDPAYFSCSVVNLILALKWLGLFMVVLFLWLNIKHSTPVGFKYCFGHIFLNTTPF